MGKKVSTQPGILETLGRVVCPKCKSEVIIHGEKGERMDDGHPLRCPECRSNLNDECCKQLGWKR